ncbi:hypothetical protein SAMN05421636_11441 [Pricia antarctica]|uniref:Uncharacterized protein n=1 Tax=Pricia antarctica TaxID=641691 RepID=A0A1G7IV17_9FLAO|nr:hypothetical protein SAMN05421636_11441 [Pricia antarctica]
MNVGEMLYLSSIRYNAQAISSAERTSTELPSSQLAKAFCFDSSFVFQGKIQKILRTS